MNNTDNQDNDSPQSTEREVIPKKSAKFASIYLNEGSLTGTYLTYSLLLITRFDSEVLRAIV